MLELGEFSQKLHEKVGEEVVKNKIDILVTVGKEAIHIANTAKEKGLNEIYICKNNNEAVEILNNNIQENDLILLKASNGMKFGEILEGINKNF